jgi:hypothetical protein
MLDPYFQIIVRNIIYNINYLYVFNFIFLTIGVINAILFFNGYEEWGTYWYGLLGKIKLSLLAIYVLSMISIGIIAFFKGIIILSIAPILISGFYFFSYMPGLLMSCHFTANSINKSLYVHLIIGCICVALVKKFERRI